jgi:hypothetical protein
MKIEKGDLKKGFSEADNVVSGTPVSCGSSDAWSWFAIKFKSYSWSPGPGK